MLTQSEQITNEHNRQTAVKVLFVCIAIALLFLIFRLVPMPWSLYISIFALAYGGGYWEGMQKDFEHRLVMVTFKTQTHPLFIFQRSPDDKDVFTRRKYATDMLVESKNNHRVKVVTHIFGDVMVFIDTVAPDGKVTTDRKFVKGATPATQTWFEYQNYCVALESEFVNDFIFKRRGDPAGDEWFNVHHFNQRT